MKHTCPVCGYPHLTERPRTKRSGGSFEICPSCGFQFGVSDDDRAFTYAVWRKRWRAGGMKWSGKDRPPPRWNPALQISKIESREH